MIFEAQQLMPLCLWVVSFMTVYRVESCRVDVSRRSVMIKYDKNK